MPISRGVKVGIVGTVAIGMLAVGGYGAYNIISGLSHSVGNTGLTTTNSTASPISSKPPGAKEITKAADAFLKAWSSGDTAKAAALTDSAQEAASGLDGYRDHAHVTSVRAVPSTTSGAQVNYTVDAHLSYQGISKEWKYTSSLTVIRSYYNRITVKWAPSVLHPGLKDGDSLVTGVAKTPDVDIVDRNGKVLDISAYPSLTQIAAQLRERYSGHVKQTGTPGIETYVEDSDGGTGATLLVLRKGVDAKLRTTLDATAQAAAEKAVLAKPQSGVTALDTDTGGIMAIAFNPASGQDIALQSLEAPGSTFKIVTATALLNAGVTPQTHSQCVSGYSRHLGKAYTNVSRDNPGADFAWDFANSCNTGFIRLAGDIGPTTLTTTGRTYYGLGTDWYVGTSTDDGNIPGGTGDEMTSEMIGQGQVVMTTLNMASVSATVVDGRFHQPSLLQDSSVIDQRAQISTSPLPSGVRTDLMQMMHRTITDGTAYAAMHDFGGTVGAKTGSAEASTGAPNGWFTAYHGHVAAAAMVVQGGEGVDSAGPIVASVLRAAS
ncbi:NTF2-like N-terminal transpeptidase domain-containing protein [Actinacidiphila yanglinensis]|uniref:NTF2-like N-terminal transpeptidase domain-containing protein n=1 Tax=Actinacidiphila yanglinensis TaxID=310779 RepID=A0A1H5ZFS8_9ACTN|nr:penicillin-binding transpeptidase domain-containing protein [Actinacidiphila yanglinensis]SEG35132.1 NTF2-like N-terminal transpeptidase domain-containing protein [Actinacidiphila yanglinensis]